MPKPRLVWGLVAVGAFSGWSGAAGQPIFADGFESANTLAWTSSVGETIAAGEVYRIGDLDLRDPHVFVDLGVICFDFTDQDVPLAPGSAFNSQLATAITTDGDTDGFLDSSILLAFRPYDPGAVELRLDLASGRCTAPLGGTSCAPDPDVVPQTVAYDALALGTCLEVLAGTTHGPYSPEVATPDAPCFVSLGRDVTLDLAGVGLPLRDLQVAATAQGDPPTSFIDGQLRGFLRETDADTILLPAGLPVIGGQPFSLLLPGGAGNCAVHDDRDTLDSELGWWLYFDFVTGSVPWSGW